MAEAFFRNLAPNKFNVSSAGTSPLSQLNPLVVHVMQEVGIDVTKQMPKLLSDFMVKISFKIINMGCMDKKSCPSLFVGDVLDWNISDPKEKSLDEVRIIRDAIKSEVINLIDTLGMKNL
jgi:protein-tyrosine-phosphatase